MPTHRFNSILAFGDSMTDNGFANGHGCQHYSNGPVWVEYLSQKLGNYHHEASD